MCMLQESILLRDLPLCYSLIGELVCFYKNTYKNSNRVISFKFILKRKYSTENKISFNLQYLTLPKDQSFDNSSFE